MDFFDVILVLIRRWKVAVSVTVLGVALTAWIVSGVGREYESFASVVFLPASVRESTLGDSVVRDEVNPYLGIGITGTLARVIPIAVQSAETRDRAEALGLARNYEVVLDDVEPIVFISAKASTPEISSATLDYVIFELDRELTDRLVLDPDTPVEERPTLEVVSEIRAVPNSGGRIKVAGVMTVTVAVAVLLACFGVEGWHRRRSAPRSSVVAAPSAASSPGELVAP